MDIILNGIKIGVTIFVAGATVYSLSAIFVYVMLKIGNRLSD